MTKQLLSATIIATTLLLLLSSCKKEAAIPGSITDQRIQLGRELFFDKNLSNPTGQSCASCHAPNASFSDLEHNIVSPGAVSDLFGNRNAPMASYSMYIPAFHFDTIDFTYIGGLFWDGRVNTLEEQAQKPFMNPLEMNITSISMLLNKVKNADYYALYRSVNGAITNDTATAFSNIAKAIAAYERSSELNPFTSKYDYYLKGQSSLSAQELRGLKLFNDTARAKCGNCHVSTADDVSGKVLFTDFTYDNIGVPRNSYNPFYTMSSTYNSLGSNYIDYGLGSILKDPAEYGKFRVPSLRNIALTAPYFHNGAFGTLEEVVHFYNTRDVAGSGFGKPEVASTVNTTETGNLKLTAQEEADIVAFLKTLTDGGN
jgi:cytochrome c peroxidase